TPPVLRICTEATCPRKKTWSGKILLVMSDALRAASLPAAAIAVKPDKIARQITIEHTIRVHADFMRASATKLKTVDCTLIARLAKANGAGEEFLCASP